MVGNRVSATQMSLKALSAKDKTLYSGLMKVRLLVLCVHFRRKPHIFYTARDLRISYIRAHMTWSFPFLNLVPARSIFSVIYLVERPSALATADSNSR